MQTHLNRRSFLKKSALVGVGSLLGVPTMARPARGASSTAGVTGVPDLAVVKGGDYFKSTLVAVDRLGGMGRLIPKGARVGLLINHPFRHPGTHVNPAIALAVLKMCYGAGTKSIHSLKDEPHGYWQRTALTKRWDDVVKSVVPSSGKYVTVGIPRGKFLKNAEIIKDLMEADVLINVSISDSTECIVTNGPFGPGKIIKPQKVVAGVDPVAVDTYCAGLLGLAADQIGMIGKSAEFGLGEMNLGKLRISEIET